MQTFGDIAFSPSVMRHQRRRGSLEAYQHEEGRAGPDGLGPDEVEFLAERDSFYLASVGESGWPYVQHRGGPAGFLCVVDPTHLVGPSARAIASSSPQGTSTTTTGSR